jgi:hypothetical protein
MNTSPTPRPMMVSLELEGAERTRLHGHWLVLARFMWATLIGLILAFFLANLPVYFTQLHTICTGSVCARWQLTPTNARALQNVGISVSLYAIFSLVLSLFSSLVWFSVAAFIAWRKSNDWLALLASLLLVTQGVLLFSGSPPPPLQYSSTAWYLPTVFLLLLDSTLYLLVFSLFPNGRFVPAWMHWLVTAEIALGVIFSLWPTSSWTTETLLTSPTTSQILFIWVNIIGWISIIGGQIYRYRRVSSPTERQQTKWVVLGIIEGPVLAAVYYTPPLLFPSLRAPDSLYFLLFKPVFTMAFLFAPLCFGIAILRYRLWDIDVLINRTLVYGTLTVSLALVYFSLVVGLQSVVGLFTGQVSQSPFVIVVSTLAIAALFQPLRRRLQKIIDRRFYRRKYDAARTLAAFSATLRNEVDLHQLREHLVAVVEETMQPSHVSLWLRPPEPSRKRQTWLLARTDEEE